jgi:hypothetical protein
LRFGSQHSQLGNVSFPNLAIGLDRPLSEASAVTPGSGQTRYYQAIYRDLGQNFCSAGTLNVTNAVQIIW